MLLEIDQVVPYLKDATKRMHLHCGMAEGGTTKVPANIRPGEKHSSATSINQNQRCNRHSHSPSVINFHIMHSIARLTPFVKPFYEKNTISCKITDMKIEKYKS